MKLGYKDPLKGRMPEAIPPSNPKKNYSDVTSPSSITFQNKSATIRIRNKSKEAKVSRASKNSNRVESNPPSLINYTDFSREIEHSIFEPAAIIKKQQSEGNNDIPDSLIHLRAENQILKKQNKRLASQVQDLLLKLEKIKASADSAYKHLESEQHRVFEVFSTKIVSLCKHFRSGVRFDILSAFHESMK